MSVQIKPLLGYVNPMNSENNTLSLLIKSNYQLREHLSNSLNKILSALKSIMEKYDSKYTMYFYHKIRILCDNKKDPKYHRSKKYAMIAKNLEIELRNSFVDILRKNFGKLLSHFINIKISLNDETLVLDAQEFTNLNWLIRDRLAKINDVIPTFNNGEGNIVKDSNESLFIDDNEVGNIVKDSNESLFIDDNEVGNIVKDSNESLFIDDNNDSHFNDPFERRINEAKEIALKLKMDMIKTNRKFIKVLGSYYDYLIS